MLALDLEDSTRLSQYFSDVDELLSCLLKPPQANMTSIALSDGTANYAIPDVAGNRTYTKIHALIMDDALLQEASEAELAGYTTTWPSSSGTPVAFTQDYLSRYFKLFPEPDFDSEAGAYDWDNYLEDHLIMVAGLTLNDLGSGFYDIHVFPQALLTLAREFSIDSKHRDLEFAQSCEQLATLILRLTGNM